MFSLLYHFVDYNFITLKKDNTLKMLKDENITKLYSKVSTKGNKSRINEFFKKSDILQIETNTPKIF